MPKIDPFERQSTEYDAWFEENDFAYFSELIAVKRQLPHKGRGLEIGVGTGRFAAPLGIECGLEPSHQMGKIARCRRIRVVEGVAEKLPFANDLFDYVLMITTICFLDEIDAAFNEVNRVLTKSGHFIIGFIDRNSPIGQLYEKSKKNNEFYRIANFYSVDEVITHLKQTGFNIINIIQTVFHSLNEIQRIETAINGYGKGSFVVIRAEKRN